MTRLEQLAAEHASARQALSIAAHWARRVRNWSPEDNAEMAWAASRVAAARGRVESACADLMREIVTQRRAA